MKRSIYILILCFAFNCGFAQNQQKIDSLLDVLETVKEDTNKVNTLNKLCWQFMDSDLEKVVNYANEALELSEKLNYKKGLSSAYDYLGRYYQHRSDYPKALDYYALALKLAKEIGHKQNEFSITTNIGITYEKQGDYVRSVKSHMAALEIANMMKNKFYISICLSNLGTVHCRQGNYSKAKEYHLEALSVNKELGKKKNMARVMVNLGNVYYYEADYDKALEYYEKSIVIGEELGDKFGLGGRYSNVANVYCILGDYDKAIEVYSKSLKIAEEIGNKRGIALCLSNTGIAYLGQGNYKKAIEYTEKGLSIAKKIGAKETIKTSLFGLSEIYTKMNKHVEAFDYYKLYSRMKDSLLNEKKHKQIVEMEAKYESEKKEKDIELLSEKSKVQELRINNRNYIIYGLGGGLCLIIIIALLFLRQNKLKAKQKATELEQRALRTQMNPHFIFNSLNSIQKFFMESKHEKANEYLADFGNLMRKILENSSKQQITVANEVSTLKLYLSLEKARLDDMLNYEINVDGGIDEYHTLIPPLVIQPYVENAIWHGIVPKKAPGKVMVSLKIKNNFLICTVEDDGIGIEKSKQLKQGGDKEHEPMGMKLTAERVEKVETQALDPGTRITIYIPIT